MPAGYFAASQTFQKKGRYRLAYPMMCFCLMRKLKKSPNLMFGT